MGSATGGSVNAAAAGLGTIGCAVSIGAATGGLEAAGGADMMIDGYDKIKKKEET